MTDTDTHRDLLADLDRQTVEAMHHALKTGEPMAPVWQLADDRRLLAMPPAGRA